VLVTEWDEFRGLDLKKMASLMARPVLIDGRNIFDPLEAARAGFDYAGIGHGASLQDQTINRRLRATA
jgi:UDPglucose 6-dehydrogenase